MQLNNMRKMRAWNTLTKSMTNDFYIDNNNITYKKAWCKFDTPNLEIELDKHLIIMEYVGKDMDGKDIFVNDIVKYFDPEKNHFVNAKVYYKENEFGYYPLVNCINPYIKVLGNIYENPTLL